MRQPRFQAISHGAHMVGVACQLEACDFTCLAQPDDLEDVLRPGAPIGLVVGAEHQLVQRCALFDVERADAFRRVELVTGDGEEVDAELDALEGLAP